MSSKHLIVGINWYGPYSLNHAREVAYNDFGGGLYLCLGKRKGQHEINP